MQFKFGVNTYKGKERDDFGEEKIENHFHTLGKKVFQLHLNQTDNLVLNKRQLNL